MAQLVLCLTSGIKVSGELGAILEGVSTNVLPISRVWWRMPLTPAGTEAKAGGSL